jgi:hypothetical protein
MGLFHQWAYEAKRMDDQGDAEKRIFGAGICTKLPNLFFMQTTVRLVVQ